MTDSTRKLMKKADELLYGYQEMSSSQINILLERIHDKNIKIVFVNDDKYMAYRKKERQ